MQLTREELLVVKQQALKRASEAGTFMLLDNHQIMNACGENELEFGFALGAKTHIECKVGNGFNHLKEFIDQHPAEYVFGFLSYDLKNEIEMLHSKNENRIQFPDMYFFVPEQLILVDKELKVLSGEEGITEWLNGKIEKHESELSASVILQNRVTEADYLHKVNTIREHIIEGDVYELNYCVEFYAEGATIDPFHVYDKLSELSPAPFSGMFRLDDCYLMCASPERFLKLMQGKLTSQPIKGTIKRGATSDEDEINKLALYESEKERAENLMIVDLVRNDLARSSITGSVEVDELFGIYSFRNLHQMISTVSSHIKPETHPVDAIRNAFPMGSMTGAPKIRAMEIIDELETTKRGLYSGAIGYFTPQGNFDFNVVIRSIQYNAQQKYVSIEVGSAITYDSDPAKEYEECLLKAKAMMDVLKG